MPENEYVATAAAEKRLREVLADRLPGASVSNVDDLATVLLDGSEIDYKPRTRKVTISLTLPEKGSTKTASKATTETEAGVVTAPEGTPVGADDGSTGSAEYGGPPTPRIAPFAPVLNPDADYEDVHYD